LPHRIWSYILPFRAWIKNVKNRWNFIKRLHSYKNSYLGLIPVKIRSENAHGLVVFFYSTLKIEVSLPQLEMSVLVGKWTFIMKHPHRGPRIIKKALILKNLKQKIFFQIFWLLTHGQKFETKDLFKSWKVNNQSIDLVEICHFGLEFSLLL